jgi:hypothetical protein
VDPYQQGKAHSQVADGEDGIQANIRNNTRERPKKEVLQLRA